MIYWLLPLIFSFFFIGLNGLGAIQSRRNDVPEMQVVADVSAQAFAAYVNAVASYVIANPAFSGSVPWASLAPYLAPGQPQITGATNQVYPTTTGTGHSVYVWVQLPPGGAFSMIKALGGDASIGVVNGTQWVSPVYGVSSSAVPGYVSVPSGSVLSMIQIGS